ncbi:MAG: hypothetical protein JWP66_360 [Naasia sp.]|nr:hypothetical protein [Naasia sp.]
MAVTTPLLQFLLSLLGEPEATTAFLDDPDTYLESHGVHNLCLEDTDAIMPLLLDYAPINGNRNEYHTGGNTVTGGDGGAVAGAGGVAAGVGGTGGTGGSGGSDHAAAVERLTSIVNNFSYTSLDDRDTILDQSLNQSFLVGDDLDLDQDIDVDTTVVSGDHNNVATGFGSVDASADTSINSGGGSVNTGSGDNIDAGGDVNTGTGDNIDAGGDVNTGTITDSGNSGDTISGNSGPVNTGTITDSGNSGDTNLAGDDLNNGQQIDTDVRVNVEDVAIGNEDSNFGNEESVVANEFEDIGNEDAYNDDSYNEEELEVELEPHYEVN